MTFKIRPRPRNLLAARALVAIALLVALVTYAPRAEAAQVTGVQVHALWSNVDSAELERQLDDVKASGAGLIRVDSGWATLEEAGKGQFSSWYLGKFDNLISKAEARGLKVLITFGWSPCWASSAPETLKQGCSAGWFDRGVANYPPIKSSDYAEALAFMAKRYGKRVAAWEIWNEPNLQDFWVSPDPARDYAALVKAAYPVAKAADPSATIIAGSLCESDFRFTQALYDHGIKGSFDAYSIHPYSTDKSPLDTLGGQYDKSSFIRGVPAVRDVLTRNGDAKPMWLTEFGWSTSTRRDGRPWENGVSEADQAAYMKLAFEQMRQWDYVEVGVTYNLKNKGSDPLNREHNFGLTRRDNTRKPAFAALQEASRSVAEGLAPPDAPPLEPPAPLPPPPEQSPTAPTTTSSAPAPANASALAGTTAGTTAGTHVPAASGPAGASETGSASGPGADGAPVRVSLRLDSAGRRTVRALGSVRGGRTELVSLTAFHAPAGKRFRRVSTRTAVVRGGAFRTKLSRYKRGRWRVQATLRGSASVVGAQRRRLSDDDDPGPDRILEDQRRSAEDGDESQPDPATLIESRVSFGEGITPGPLPGGGYVSQGDEEQGDGTLERIDEALEAAGFETTSSSEYSAADAATVRRFQRAHGLLVDGVVGRQTLAALQQYAG